jgi:serine/threonine-protein kinase RsbW
MGERLIEIPARRDLINRICQAVQQEALQAGFNERAAYACQLAVSEACENIVLHGYGSSGEGTIRAEIEGHSDGLTVVLTDDAPPFNPAEAEAQAPEPREDPPAGGLGLYILHRVMDEIHYERTADENRLTLRKAAEGPTTD